MIAQVPAANDEAENAHATADVPVVDIDVPEEEWNTSASLSTASSVPAQFVSPRLQRISTPKKKNSPEEMSVQEFFKFSMLQREEPPPNKQ